MEKRYQNFIWALVGLGLVAWGLLMFLSGILLPLFGIEATWLDAWRYWPLVVVAVGDFLAVLALQFRRKPGMGALFIPALPVMTVGVLLFFGSVFNAWHIWSWGWSFIILALAFGFVLAMLTMRNIWLGIPAILIGMNALALTFTAVTGLWHWWAVLWTVEPLAIGMMFFLIASQTRSATLVILGASFAGFAAVSFYAMSGLVFASGILRVFMGPALLILGGAALIWWTMVRPAKRLEQ